jgi:threonine dehydrogenase-like Zn-dependent dehydrogenase
VTAARARRCASRTEAVLDLTGGVGVDATLECVDTGQAMQTALSIARPGSMVGYVAAMDERRAIKSLVRVGTP